MSMGEKRAGGLRGGVAVSDITTDAPQTAIRDRLYAKALVLDDGTTRLAIVTMDVTAIGGREISRGALPDVGQAFLPALRGRIEKELGIAGANVLVNASHTHPPGRMLCDDKEQVKRTFDAVRRAASDLTPVTFGAGAGHEDRLTLNRTLRLKDGRHWTVRHANPCPPDDLVAGVGPLDPQIGILRFDRLDGTPLAVVYNFASHLLFGDLQARVTADFPGIASKRIEQTLGHGATALFLQGAAGDVIDVGFKNFNRTRDIEPLGATLGQDVLDALKQIPTSDAALRIASETIDLPRRTDIPQRIADLERRQHELLESLRYTTLNFKAFLPLHLKHLLSPDNPADYLHTYLQAEKIGDSKPALMDEFNRKQVEKYLHNIRAMEELVRIRENIDTLKKHQGLNEESGQATVAAEIQGIRIGDCVLIASPLEVLTEVSLNIKKASPCPNTFLAPFSNGYLHYGPPASYYDKGGYEVTECLIGPQWQELFESAAGRIIRRLWEE
jgi:hypothetical protein